MRKPISLIPSLVRPIAAIDFAALAPGLRRGADLMGMSNADRPHSKTRMVLAIAENARIDHVAGHPRSAAPFNCARERAAVKRAAARGLLAITQTSRGEVWAAITLDGRRELARMQGEPAPV